MCYIRTHCESSRIFHVDFSHQYEYDSPSESSVVCKITPTQTLFVCTRPAIWIAPTSERPAYTSEPQTRACGCRVLGRHSESGTFVGVSGAGRGVREA